MNLVKLLSSTLLGVTVSSACGKSNVSPSTVDAGSSNPWNHANLTATDGTKISIDFMVERTGRLGTAVAFPIHANVTGGAASAASRVRLLLVQKAAGKQYSLGWPARYAFLPEIDRGTITIDLSRQDDGHFSAQLQQAISLHPAATEVSPDDCAGDPCVIDQPLFQEIAVVVDRAWLKDPMSGSSNFKIDMNQTANLLQSN